MKYSRTIPWIVFIAIAVFTRVWMLGAAPFAADYMEFYKLALRHQSIIEFWKNPPWMNQIPLNETFTLLLIHAGLPATPFVVRLPFAVMGILALYFIWRFARKQFGSGAALLTLLVAVFNPYYLYFSRTAYHYAGAACWSAALFITFWSIKEALEQNRMPSRKQLGLWFATAVLACHMHMSVWVVAGLQGLLLLIFGWRGLRAERKERVRFLIRFSVGSVLLLLIMSRWIYRAATEVLQVAGGGTKNLGNEASSEFFRLLPAYFAGQNLFAVLLLLAFVAVVIFALFGTSEPTRRYRSLTWICVLHFVVLMLYVGIVGGGVAKITYFSAVWPHYMILLGAGVFLGIQRLASKPGRIGLYALLVGGYLALTVWPDWAIIHLEGKPTPYYKINNWVLKNLPAGTSVLTDRWLEPWNELAVHNPGGINYTFTVPDEPIENYERFHWRRTAEQFFNKYPQAALLEVSRGRYEDELGPWTFRQHYFSRVVSLTNESAMILRRMKIYPTENYAEANTNRVVTRIFYNTPDDLIAAARKEGRDVLRLYGSGWSYAKPGWQQGHFEDYRILKQAAEIDLYDLKDTSLNGTLEISAATARQPKTVSVHGATTVFGSGHLRTWTLPLTLQPGKNEISFTSPSGDPLFVLDIRWKPAHP